MAETTNTIEYQSKVIPQGSVESTITEIKSLHNVYSWQVTMLSTEDYEKAAEKYRQIYRQLNGSNFLMYNNKTWKFKGDYRPPDENLSFASSILNTDINESALQKLKIEIALNYNMTYWTVKVLVYEKENDADIRPDAKPN